MKTNSSVVVIVMPSSRVLLKDAAIFESFPSLTVMTISSIGSEKKERLVATNVVSDSFLKEDSRNARRAMSAKLINAVEALFLSRMLCGRHSEREKQVN